MLDNRNYQLNNRLIQTELRESSTVKEIKQQYHEYIERVDGQRLILCHEQARKTLLLPYAHRESAEYRAKIKKTLQGIYFKRYRMITLTTDPKRFRIWSARGIESMYKNIKRSWNQLRTALKRRHGDFRYLCVLEFTKSMLPHLHIVCDIAEKVDLSVIRGNWSQGKQFHVGHCCDGLNVRDYVLKYVTKSIKHDYAALMWRYSLRTYSLSHNAQPHDDWAAYEKISAGFKFVGTATVLELQFYFKQNITAPLCKIQDGLYCPDDH